MKYQNLNKNRELAVKILTIIAEKTVTGKEIIFDDNGKFSRLGRCHAYASIVASQFHCGTYAGAYKRRRKAFYGMIRHARALNLI